MNSLLGASADSVAPASESADVSADADADAAIDEPESPMDEVAKEGASADEGSESKQPDAIKILFV